MRYLVQYGETISHKTESFDSESEAIDFAKSLDNQNSNQAVRVIDDNAWSLKILWQNSTAVRYWG